MIDVESAVLNCALVTRECGQWRARIERAIEDFKGATVKRRADTAAAAARVLACRKGFLSLAGEYSGLVERAAQTFQVAAEPVTQRERAIRPVVVSAVSRLPDTADVLEYARMVGASGDSCHAAIVARALRSRVADGHYPDTRAAREILAAAESLESNAPGGDHDRLRAAVAAARLAIAGCSATIEAARAVEGLAAAEAGNQQAELAKLEAEAAQAARTADRARESAQSLRQRLGL